MDNNGTSAVVSLTFVFNSFYYKCDINPENSGTTYLCLASDSLAGFDCENSMEQMLLAENNDDNANIDSVIIDAVIVNTHDDNTKRLVYSPSICLDLHDCGRNKALFNLNTISWETATNQDLTCN